MQLIAEGRSYRGAHVQWITKPGPQISISAVDIPGKAVLVNPKARGNGFALRFVWPGGGLKIGDSGKSCCGGMDYGTGIKKSFDRAVHSFQIQIVCTRTRCPAVRGQILDVNAIELAAVDNSPPVITPDETTTNLANETGRWIRGIWDASFRADSDVGVCRAEVLVGSVVVGAGSTYKPHTGSWTQCGQGAGTLGGSGANGVSHTLDTTKHANGALSVEYYAADAAQPANVRAPVYKVKIDNAPVTLSLSGPTQALTTAGPQTVTARAAAGPSGLAGIWCSVDKSPSDLHRGASANVAVAAPGLNTISCYARNNAVNAAGITGRSPLESWTVDIRKPSVSLIGLVHVADALHCVRRHLRVRIRAHWTTARIRGHRVRVWIPAQTRRVGVEHCHPRVKIVLVHRNGRTVRERVVELPHRVSGARERVRFGSRPIVSGWLGGAHGNALGGQIVHVLAAPADGSRSFHLVAKVKTARNGTWSVRLRPGPSRLIEASYAGDNQIAPAISNAASITVPASVWLQVKPRRTHWGSTIRISGHLRGGHIPASGELVVLRIGWRGGSAEIGHVYTDPSGRFSASYTFLRGTGTEVYRIRAQTARESDYPFAPSGSRRIRIKVGSADSSRAR